MAEGMKIGIIGEGKMGTNLFYFLLDQSVSLAWIGSRDADIEKMRKTFARKLDRSLSSGIYDQKGFEARSANTIISHDLNMIGNCDLVIETVNEDLSIKLELFREMVKIVPGDCILASNSSSIIPSRLIPAESKKDKIVGLHFFYPLVFKDIVEFIVTENTSQRTKQCIIDFLKIIKRNHILLDEKNAFILNKIFLDFQNEAFIIVSEGMITIAQMDSLIKKQFFPVGVFDFCDNVGNDIMLTSVRNYTKDYPERDHYRLFINELERLVMEHKSGIKSGAGFYSYPVDNQPADLLLNNLQPGVMKKAVKRLQLTLISSINKFSTQSGISIDIMNNAMKEYLGMENDLSTLFR